MNRPAPTGLRSVSRRMPPCVLSRCSVSACFAMENWWHSPTDRLFDIVLSFHCRRRGLRRCRGQPLGAVPFRDLLRMDLGRVARLPACRHCDASRIWHYSTYWTRKVSKKHLLWIIPAAAGPFVVVASIGGVDLFSYMQKSRDDIRLRSAISLARFLVEEDDQDNPKSALLFPCPRPHYAWHAIHWRTTGSSHFLLRNAQRRRRSGRTLPCQSKARRNSHRRSLASAPAPWPRMSKKVTPFGFTKSITTCGQLPSRGNGLRISKIASRAAEIQNQMGDARLSLERELRGPAAAVPRARARCL